MAFSPTNITKHRFSKALRGYDPIEVEAYLEVVAEKYSDLIEENKVLKERNNAYETNFREFDQTRNKFRESQINAQKNLQGLKLRSEKEAKIILMDAKLKAESIQKKAYKAVRALRQEIEELKQLKSSFIIRTRNILRQQLEVIDVYASDFHIPNSEDKKGNR